MRYGRSGKHAIFIPSAPPERKLSRESIAQAVRVESIVALLILPPERFIPARFRKHKAFRNLCLTSTLNVHPVCPPPPRVSTSLDFAASTLGMPWDD